MVIKEPRKFVTTDQGHADVLNIPITTLYENDQKLSEQVESIKSDPAANGVASKEALDTHVANTEMHVTVAKQEVWDSAQENAELYTRNYAAPKDHTHSASDLPSATTQTRGITKLNNSVSSSATDEAATANAVKQAYNEATAAKQLGNERKADVVAALVAIGVSASTSETWAQLINKMAGVIKATGNAAPTHVLAGATFSNASGNGRTGTMPNRSAQDHHQPAINSTAWPGDRVFLMPPDGYFNGQSWVYVSTPDLRPENLLVGKNILGVAGALQPGRKYAIGTFNATNTGQGVVNGLVFRPRNIIITADPRNIASRYIGIYSEDAQDFGRGSTRLLVYMGADTGGSNYVSPLNITIANDGWTVEFGYYSTAISTFNYYATD